MKLAFVGDVMLGRLVNETLAGKDAAYPWGRTLPLLRSADLTFGNLECALTERGRPWTRTPKVFHFRSDPKNGDSLSVAGFDAVSLANNHILDFETEGLVDTIQCLDRLGIAHAGAGVNLAEAREPAVLQAGEETLAFLAFTDNQAEWAASPRGPGVHYVDVERRGAEFQLLLDLIRSAKRAHRTVVVSAHWGSNWGDEPPEEHRIAARLMAESGADVVFGHSCHVCRGIELIERSVVMYGCGDFVDDYRIDPLEHNDLSFIFVLEDDRLSLHPTRISEFQAQPAGGRDADAAAGRMKALCEQLGTPATWDPAAQVLSIGLGPRGFEQCAS